MTKGIDVSKYNGVIDWANVKASGIEFVMIRAGYGNTTTQIDSYFKRNIEGALAEGLKVGCYWMNYFRTVDEARKEANAFLEIVKPYKDKITFPMAADYEGDSIRYAKESGYTPTKKTVTDQMIAFCETVKAAGYIPAWYTDLSTRSTYFNADRLPYDYWLADWDDNKQGFNAKPNVACAIHQTTSNGSISGISGRVDLNVAHKEYGTAPAPKPTTQDKKVDVSYQVRTKKHGLLPAVKNLNDYAGWHGSPITQIKATVSAGSLRGRVHANGKWTGYLYGSTISLGDSRTSIDAVELYYYTPTNIRPFKKAKYRVATTGEYYPWQTDNDKDKGMDGYAGVIGKPITKLQISIE